MRMQLKVQLELQMLLKGIATETIFPLVEAWLWEDTDHQKAIAYYTERIAPERQYRSVIDLLFAETFPQWQDACFAYYRGEGPLLKDILTPAEVEMYQRGLLFAVKTAYAWFCRKREASWRAVSGAVRLYLDDDSDLLERAPR